MLNTLYINILYIKRVSGLLIFINGLNTILLRLELFQEGEIIGLGAGRTLIKGYRSLLNAALLRTATGIFTPLASKMAGVGN